MSKGIQNPENYPPKDSSEKTPVKPNPSSLVQRALERLNLQRQRLLARITHARSKGESGIDEISVALTPVEEHQAFKPDRSPRDTTLELSNRIQKRLQSDNALRVQFLTNPYSPQAGEIFQQEFGEPLTGDAIRALILAQPPGEYDRKFAQLSVPQQQEALYKQIDRSADMTVNVSSYVEQSGNKFFDMTDAQIYEELSHVTFDGKDATTAGQDLSLHQSRGFQLSLINFIEDMRGLRPYGEEFTKNIQQTLQKYKITDKAIQNIASASIEVTPLGIVVYLEDSDYSLVTNEKADNAYRTAGKTLFSDELPEQLKGKVILINKGSTQNSTEPKEIQSTRKHELLHSAYSSFFERAENHTGREKLENIQTYDEYLDFAGVLRLEMLITASNEVISYNSKYSYFYQDLSQLGGTPYEYRMEELRTKLSNKSSILSSDQKESVYLLYEQQRIKYMEQVAEYQWIAHQLFDAARIGRNGLTEAKALALLQNTRPDRISRLGSYFGVEPEQVHDNYIQARSGVLESFTKDVDQLVTPSLVGGSEPEGEIPDALSNKIGYGRFTEVMALYPTEIVPTLLKVITGINDAYYVGETMDTLSTIVRTQARNLSAETIAEIQSAIENMDKKRAGEEFKDVRAKRSELNRVLYTLAPKMVVYGADESLRPDFKGGAILRGKIKSVIGYKPEYMSYTWEEERALADILTPEELMSKHLIIYDQKPEAIPVLATILGKVSQINTSKNDVYMMNGLGLIEKLEQYYNKLLPEQRQSLESILSILEVWNPPDQSESLRDFYREDYARRIAVIREKLPK